MTISDFLVAAFIALFTMTGGVLLSASITAPENCAKVLEYLHNWVRRLLAAAIALLALAVLNRYVWHASDSFAHDPLVIVSLAYLAFFGLFWLAEKFTRVGIIPSDPRHDHAKQP